MKNNVLISDLNMSHCFKEWLYAIKIKMKSGQKNSDVWAI